MSLLHTPFWQQSSGFRPLLQHGLASHTSGTKEVMHSHFLILELSISLTQISYSLHSKGHLYSQCIPSNPSWQTHLNSELPFESEHYSVFSSTQGSDAHVSGCVRMTIMAMTPPITPYTKIKVWKRTYIWVIIEIIEQLISKITRSEKRFPKSGFLGWKF